MQYSKAIVTGGAGFIGSHLVKRLVKNNIDVLVVDNLSRGKIANLEDCLPKIKFIKMDLAKAYNLAPIFSGYEVVFNLAALNTGVNFDVKKEQQLFEENMLLQMLPLKATSSVSSIKRFVQVSSASVYSRKMMNVGRPILETQDNGEPEPSKEGYALAKKMGERLAMWYSKNTSLETVRVRFINVFGENDTFDDSGHFIPVITRKIIQAKDTFEAFGNGNQKRSFLYVEDAVEALLLLMEKGVNNDVYNVDTGYEKSIREIIELVQKSLHKEQLKVEYNKSQPTGSLRRVLDASKIMKLGWSPHTSFEEGMERTIHDIKKKLESEVDKNFESKS